MAVTAALLLRGVALSAISCLLERGGFRRLLFYILNRKVCRLLFIAALPSAPPSNTGVWAAAWRSRPLACLRVYPKQLQQSCRAKAAWRAAKWTAFVDAASSAQRWWNNMRRRAGRRGDERRRRWYRALWKTARRRGGGGKGGDRWRRRRRRNTAIRLLYIYPFRLSALLYLIRCLNGRHGCMLARLVDEAAALLLS